MNKKIKKTCEETLKNIARTAHGKSICYALYEVKVPEVLKEYFKENK